MNKVTLKLFIWKHPGSLSLIVIISVLIIPLVIIPYFFIALFYFIFYEFSGMIGKKIFSIISPKTKEEI